MKIIYKLILSFTLIITIFNSGLFFSLKMIDKKSQLLIDSYTLNIMSVNNIRSSWDNFRSARDLSQSILSMTQITDRTKTQAAFDQYFEAFLSPLKQLLNEYDRSSWEYELMSSVITTGEAWKRKNDTLLFAKAATSIPSYIDMDKSTAALEKNINTLVERIVEKSETSAISIVSENQELLNTINWSAFLVAVVSIILSALLSFSIVKPIKRLSQLMVALSKGKTDITVPYQKGGCEISSMARNLELFRTNDKQRQLMISNVENVVDQLVHESSRLSEVSTNVNLELNKQKEKIQSANINSQHSSKELSEISTLTDMALISAKEAAADSDNANKQVTQSETIISLSTEQVENVFNCINKLEEGSKNIEEVIKVINSIAEQTNLLALNAAIEAARAGEHGRGFSVVADEVRSLATKTQESTQNIYCIISNIQKDTIEASEAIDKSRNLAYENQKSSKALSNSMEAINSSFTIVSEKSEITVAQMKKQLDRALQIQQSMLSANEMAENSLSSASTLVEISKKLDTLSVALNSTISHQN